MWKSRLDAVIESCMAMDPTVYVHWLLAQREAQEQAAALERPEPRKERVSRIELVLGRKEATA